LPKLLAGLAAAALALSGAAAVAPAAAAQVAVYPSPGTNYNLPGTQIAFRGVSPSAIGAVTVSGSSTGVHTGQLQADSDGQGASFVPSQPFAKGETVTVNTGLNIIGAQNGTFSFRIGAPLGPIQAMPVPTPSAGPGDEMHFRSRPDLSPASLTIDKNAAPSSQGDIFLAPQFGPAQNGPMILDSRGNLVWFHPVPVSQQTIITDFRVQRYDGAPVLTWFQGITNHGSGAGEGVIFDRNYKQIATVHAGNGAQMDLHEFLITGNDAWIVAVQPVSFAGVGKPTMDNIVQEIDIKTGLVLFDWHALDHVSPGDTYFPPSGPGFVFDPYHTNSVWPTSDGGVIISMRNTSAIYKVDQNSGQVLWELSGRHSSFKMGPGVSTAFQHSVIQQPDGTLTIFDDGGGPPYPHNKSRGIRVSLDTKHMRASLVREYDHSPNIQANFEGNVQQLSGGDVFIGWGQQPYFSEDNASGQQIFDGRFNVPTSSYRAYRFSWSAQPPTQPAVAVGTASGGSPYLFASWNGATDVTAWQVLAGTSPNALAALGATGRSGFETTIGSGANTPYLGVRALGAGGRVLAQSPAISVPSHLSVYGRSVFVSGSGTAGVPVSCIAASACHVATTVTAGRTVIASTGPERLSPGRGGLVFFTLTGAGRSMLAQAPGGRLGVQITVKDASGLRNSSGMTLVRFGTAGRGPARSASPSGQLQLVGLSDFVNARGTGGILAACYAPTPCRTSTTISAGSTVIARTGSEYLGPGTLGYLIFSLTPAGQSLLAHAGGNQLGVQVKASSGQGTATGQLALVRFS